MLQSLNNFYRKDNVTKHNFKIRQSAKLAKFIRYDK